MKPGFFSKIVTFDKIYVPGDIHKDNLILILPDPSSNGNHRESSSLSVVSIDIQGCSIAWGNQQKNKKYSNDTEMVFFSENNFYYWSQRSEGQTIGYFSILRITHKIFQKSAESLCKKIFVKDFRKQGFLVSKMLPNFCLLIILVSNFFYTLFKNLTVIFRHILRHPCAVLEPWPAFLAKKLPDWVTLWA